MTVPEFTLVNGATIPAIGLGTYPMQGDEIATAIRVAVESGYRLIDTAEAYGNEAGVGRGIRECGIDRSELFITTKFNKQWHSVDGVRQTFAASCERLGVDYIDMLMVHWPNPGEGGYVDAVRGLAKLREEGLIRAIGVSNFTPPHLERVLAEAGVTPDVNQIQLSPFTTRDASRAFDTAKGIVTESWSPIGGGSDGLRSNPTIGAIAETAGKTATQVILRWHHQLGLLPIPKSADPERIAQNIAIFDFELSESEMSEISALDKGESVAVDSDEFGH